MITKTPLHELKLYELLKHKFEWDDYEYVLNKDEPDDYRSVYEEKKRPAKV